MKISNPPNKEFKVMVIKRLTELERRADEFRKDFNKDLENIKKNQSKLKKAIIEMKKIHYRKSTAD